MALNTTVTASLQGRVCNLDSANAQEEWIANIRDATNGTSNNTYTSNALVSDAIDLNWVSGARGDTGNICRTFLFFDNIDTATGGGTITAATLKVLGYSVGNLDVIPVSASAWGGNGSTTTLSSADYSALNKDDFNNYTPYASELTTWSTSAYNTFTLDSNAISDMNSNGFLNVALVEFQYDFNNAVPTLGFNNSSGIEFLDATNPIELSITYNAASYGNDVNGVTAANIIAINGITAANIVEVNGV